MRSAMMMMVMIEELLSIFFVMPQNEAKYTVPVNRLQQ
jgi:hypothetical protein